MNPKPVITIHGDTELVGAPLQKTLQSKFKALQKDGYNKEELAFASMCDGVEFVKYELLMSKKGSQRYVHQQPCLHTYWTACADVRTYTKIQPHIQQWLKSVNASRDHGDGNHGAVIVYCVTAEVRSARPRMHSVVFTHKMEPVEEMIYKEFMNDCNVINLRMASSSEAKKIESFENFASEINRLCIVNFNNNMSECATQIHTIRNCHTKPSDLYNNICKKFSLGVAYEMRRDERQARQIYSSIHDDLESVIISNAQRMEKSAWPEWLKKLAGHGISRWDYSKLLEDEGSWEHFEGMLNNDAHVIHIWTLIFARRACLLCAMGLVKEVSDCIVQTLHCTARVIKNLNLSLPPGVFDSWAYMMCMECIECMMIKIDPEVLAKTPSAVMILIRAELWHYAWEKLCAIGLLCDLMPGSSKDQPNQGIIDVICSGITLPKYGEARGDDQGKRLIDVLNSKEKFKNAFMSLGEMVIGAFKHAGRRRMAFSIGTRMAEFHKHVGMVKEAEQVLYDVTSLHSVQHWPQLSSSAYSILRYCQDKLRQEDKEVNSLLVLVTTPKHNNSTHDPAHHMDQLIFIAERSHYQKLLSWEPLFDLESVNVEHTGTLQYHFNDTIVIKVSLHYHGPKALKLTMATVLLEQESLVRNATLTTNRSSSAVTTSDVFREVSLNPGPLEEELLNSRPIGDYEGSKLHKVYYSSSHIEEDNYINRRQSVQRLFCRGSDMRPGNEMKPGVNTITVSGKISSPGSYKPYHIILKSGALDFVLIVPPNISNNNTVTVLPDKVDINIGLQPKNDVILCGISVPCCLNVVTGEETTIPEGAELRIVAPPTIEISPCNEGDCMREIDSHRISVTLPPIKCSATNTINFDLTVTSRYQVPSGVTPPDLVANDDDLSIAQYNIDVYCDWLTPPHIARLPLLAYEPFTFQHHERSVGDHAFVQLTMANTSPHSLIITDHKLSSSLELESFYTMSIPQVFHPGDTFSFIWQNKTSHLENMFSSSACLRLEYHPESEKDKIGPSRTAQYNFGLSNMQTVFQIKVSVDSLYPQHPIVAHQPTIITYTITNTTRGFRDASLKPDKLHWTVTPDPTKWGLTCSSKGVLDAPNIAKSVALKVTAQPLKGGHYYPPPLVVDLEKVGGDGVEHVREVEKVRLTEAQCYCVNQWTLVEVADD